VILGNKALYSKPSDLSEEDERLAIDLFVNNQSQDCDEKENGSCCEKGERRKHLQTTQIQSKF
jgi:hypothetical protein